MFKLIVIYISVFACLINNGIIYAACKDIDSVESIIFQCDQKISNITYNGSINVKMLDDIYHIPEKNGEWVKTFNRKVSYKDLTKSIDIETLNDAYEVSIKEITTCIYNEKCSASLFFILCNKINISLMSARPIDATLLDTKKLKINPVTIIGPYCLIDKTIPIKFLIYKDAKDSIYHLANVSSKTFNKNDTLLINKFNIYKTIDNKIAKGKLWKSLQRFKRLLVYPKVLTTQITIVKEAE